MADLEARAVTVVRGDRAVLRDVSLTARAGEVTCILGPNGAGKSTLARALAGLLPFTGSVRVGGEPVERMRARKRARALAFVPQRSELVAPLPVQAVVEQGRFARGDDAKAVRHAMELTQVTALAARPFTQLSEGERRRVLLARALATEAKVLVLDEPTAALDVRHALELLARLRELAGDGLCVVVVLHVLDEARRVADRVLLLNEGRAALEGAPGEVIAPEPVRRVYDVELLEGGALGVRLPP